MEPQSKIRVQQVRLSLIQGALRLQRPVVGATQPRNSRLLSQLIQAGHTLEPKGFLSETLLHELLPRSRTLLQEAFKGFPMGSCYGPPAGFLWGLFYRPLFSIWYTKGIRGIQRFQIRGPYQGAMESALESLCLTTSCHTISLLSLEKVGSGVRGRMELALFKKLNKPSAYANRFMTSLQHLRC